MVELNRTMTEPVEIIVNNCVIVRGEVVVKEAPLLLALPGALLAATVL